MIQANFSAYASYVTDSLYQWDINQKLSVEGLNLPTAPEVHFSNVTMDRAIVKQAKLLNGIVEVDIPNSLLQMPLKITAHIGVYSGATFKVVEKVEIPIKARPRPADYQIEDSDEEIYSFKALENKLNNKADSDKVNARIDNIIAHNNDSEGNTELIDIRVGVDGVTYGSAGGAVRRQIEKAFDYAKRTRAKIDGDTVYGDILLAATWSKGYINDNGGITTTTNNGESYTDTLIPITQNNQYSLRYIRNHTGAYGWFCITEYDINGNFIARTAYDESAGDFDVTTEDNNSVAYYTYTPSTNTRYIRLSLRTWLFGSSNTETEINKVLPNVINLVSLTGNVSYSLRLSANVNPNIKSVNHRGYNTIAPENTLSAFRLSKRMGFDFVEADISFTSDDYAVLLHDTTVDRTSNGTGTISNLTFDYVRSLDFGSWKSDEYTGEQIPTFDEFIALCRAIGLHPYIEIKSPATQTQIEKLIDTVKLYGMSKNVTWITASGVEYLGYIKGVCSYARVGLIVNGITERNISDLLALKTDTNDVFIDAVSTELTENMISLCAHNDIPIEVWDLWSIDQIKSANKYISGFTTDSLIAGVELYKAYS